MYPFTYKVEYCDEVDYKINMKYGLLYAETYSDAMNQLSDYYGEQSLTHIDLRVCVDGPIELPASLLRELIEKRENCY